MRSLVILLALSLPLYAQNKKQIVVEAARPQTQTGIQPNTQPSGNAVRLVLPYGHAGSVDSVALSADGKYALSGSYSLGLIGTTHLWEVSSGREIWVRRGGAATFSPDGKQAIYADGTTVQLWDISAGREVRRLTGHSEIVQGVDYSADNRTILSYSKDSKEPLIRLWDARNGRALSLLKGHEDKVENVVFSHDGRLVVSASKDKTVRLWSVPEGKLLRIFKGHRDSVQAVAISADGKIIAGGGYGYGKQSDPSIRLWDAVSGRQLRQFDNRYAVLSLAFSPDGKTLLAGTSSFGRDGEPLTLWNVATGQRVRYFSGHQYGTLAKEVKAVSWSRDGKWALSGGEDGTMRLWNTDEQSNQSQKRATRIFGGSVLFVNKRAFSRDGRLVLSDLSDGTLRLWEAESGRSRQTFIEPSSSIYGIALDDTGSIAVSGNSQNLHFWDVANGRIQRDVKADFWPRVVALSADGQKVLYAGEQMVVLDRATGRKLREFGPHNASINDARFSADGKTLVSGALDNQVRLWDAATGQLRRAWKMSEDVVAVDVSSGGEFVLGRAGNQVRVWESAGGTQIAAFEAPVNAPGGPRGIMVSQFGALEQIQREIAFNVNDDYIVSHDGNGTLRWWKTRGGQSVARPTGPEGALDFLPFVAGGRFLLVPTAQGISVRDAGRGRLLYTYLPLTQGDWLAYAPDGSFDGSPGGLEKVHFVRGLQTFALDQFAERFYRPGLINVALQSSSAPQNSLLQSLTIGVPPLVKITTPAPGAPSREQIEVTVEAREQSGGGIKAIRLYHNGRLVGGPGNLRGIVVEAVSSQPATSQATTQSDVKTQKFTVVLSPGENVLRAVAYSKTDVESKPDEKRLTFAGTVQKPALHVLVVGINEYRDASMNLAYARPDAEAMAQFFDTTARQCGLFSGVSITRLIDEAATGAAIKQGLAQLAAQTKADDMVFIYLAGHGDTAPINDNAGDGALENFYFLPAEMRQMAMKERVRQYGISRDTIDGAISKIPARKIVLIYDACKSGAALEGGTRGSGDEQQALAQLARSQGIYVLAASTGQQYAGEVKALGHGILTYALLEGLGGKAAGTDSLVKVSQLFAYVGDRVPVLAKEYRGREQWPVSFGKGQNFPLVMKP